MATYTVYAPSLRKNQSAPDPERFVFVRDGFYVWAFLLAPLWLVLRRLWLVLIIYLILTAAVGVAFKLAGASVTVEFLVSLLIALLVGLEAASLWRWTLARRGWKMLGFVVADDWEAAEHRFFTEWCRRAATTAPLATMPASRKPAAQSDVIGLFPEPRASR